MSCLQVLPGVTKLDMRVLVDRAIVEAFVMVRKRALFGVGVVLCSNKTGNLPRQARDKTKETLKNGASAGRSSCGYGNVSAAGSERAGDGG